MFSSLPADNVSVGKWRHRKIDRLREKVANGAILAVFSILTLWCSTGIAGPGAQTAGGRPEIRSSTGHGGGIDSSPAPRNQQKQGTETMQNATDPKVRLKTGLGEMTVVLYRQKAPETVANFLRYVEQGFYDGTIFHRVIKGFMIQGGGFEPGMVQKDTAGPIRNEADNGLANEKGTIAMARTSDPHSATSQFFINANDNDFLNYKSATPDGWGYCVFGKLVEGESVLDAIGRVPTGPSRGHDDVPVDDVVLEKVTLEN